MWPPAREGGWGQHPDLKGIGRSHPPVNLGHSLARVTPVTPPHTPVQRLGLGAHSPLAFPGTCVGVGWSAQVAWGPWCLESRPGGDLGAVLLSGHPWGREAGSVSQLGAPCHPPVSGSSLTVSALHHGQWGPLSGLPPRHSIRPQEGDADWERGTTRSLWEGQPAPWTSRPCPGGHGDLGQAVPSTLVLLGSTLLSWATRKEETIWWQKDGL